MNIAQEVLTKFNEDPDLLKKTTNHGCIAITLLTVFFDCNGVFNHEFLPQDHTVNKEYYLEVMRRLREVIRQKRTELWKNQSWILHHDKPLVYTSILVHEFLA